MIGMSMKVLVADSLSPLVDVAFPQTNPSFVDAWIGCLAYSLQLFFDFAGYSAMAIGLGLMLGFHFPENFNRPYWARNIQDFWRRWHMSLSSWLRDYLYIGPGRQPLRHLEDLPQPVPDHGHRRPVAWRRQLELRALGRCPRYRPVHRPRLEPRRPAGPARRRWRIR